MGVMGDKVKAGSVINQQVKLDSIKNQYPLLKTRWMQKLNTMIIHNEKTL